MKNQRSAVIGSPGSGFHLSSLLLSPSSLAICLLLGRGPTAVCCVLAAALWAAPSAVQDTAERRAPLARTAPQAAVAPKPHGRWLALFDGKSLDGWKVTKFGGDGEVYTENGRMVLEMGVDLTGVTYTRKLPRINYEVSLDAKRVDGTDFFCGLTVPVKKNYCSLILGGWGGAVCGISSIDGQDASQNETTTYRRFENGRWYHVRLRVTETKLEAWVDQDKIVDVKITGRKISTRPEVDLSKPFGLATWQTTAALRNIRLRRLCFEEADDS